MKIFIKKISFILLSVFIFLVGISFLADGYTDAYYIRFTTPKQKNLIIGTSRAAQALQPKIFENVLGIDIYNYSFSIGYSPFGKVYLESLLKKHNKQKNGTFIITVDPWSISSCSTNPNDINQFRENGLCVANTKRVNSKPNFEYLYKNLRGNYYRILSPLLPIKSKSFLHQNGWLEVSGIPMDSISVNIRTSDKLKDYKTYFSQEYKFSQVRLNYLLKTIEYFKAYGNVYLLRLPVYNAMMEIENDFMPDFDDIIKDAIVSSDGYLDLTPYNDNYQYTDGNHLYKTSGEVVSIEVAEWIKRKSYQVELQPDSL